MEKPKPHLETDPSSSLATEIATTLSEFIGTREWFGDKPFEIRIADKKAKVAYAYQIRRGENWITIQEQVSDSPSLVRTFQLEKNGEIWTYLDPYFIKYNKPSLDQLRAVFERLRTAIEASQPTQLDDSQKKLPPA